MVLDHEMKIASRFWFAIGSIMQQGSDLNPMYVSRYTPRTSYPIVPLRLSFE